MNLPVVAPIAVPTDLANKALWGASLRRSVALATYTEAALATGIWDPLKLEAELLRRKSSKLSTRGDRQSKLSVRGELRSLLKGSAPRKQLVSRIASSLPDRAVAYWANHPLFHMLDVRGNEPQLHASIVYALDSLEGPIRDYFWSGADTDWSRGSANPQADIFPESAVLEAALNDRKTWEKLNELDWLVLNVAVYFQATRIRAYNIARRAAFNSDAVFAEAVLRHPQLLVGWKDLHDVMAKDIWKMADLKGEFRLDHLKYIPATVSHLRAANCYPVPSELLELAGL